MFENQVCGGKQTMSRIAGKVVLNSACVNIQKMMRGRGREGRGERGGRGEGGRGERGVQVHLRCSKASAEAH